jgi:hypothetical protein
MDRKLTFSKYPKSKIVPAWSAEDMALAMELLKADPLYPKLAETRAHELTELALNVGAENAVEVSRIYDCVEPLKLARILRIRVLFDISLNYKFGGLGILSSYSPKPPTITVYENRLRLFREKLPKKDKPGRVFLSNLTNICVAHEIYHHIERQAFCFVNLTCKVPIVDFKLFRIEKSMTMLSEIAAHAFAMKLMDLPHLPCIIQEEYRSI